MDRQITEEVRENNKKLIEKYPFLLPRSPWTGKPRDDYNYEFTERDRVEDGWVGLFDEFCEVFNVVYKRLPENDREKCYFTQIKEKYGSLRLYMSRASEEMWDILHYYEGLSGYTCIRCGKQPKDSKGRHIIWNSFGYILPFCKECAKYVEYEFEKKYFDKPISRKQYLEENFTKYVQKKPFRRMTYVDDHYVYHSYEDKVNEIKKLLKEKSQVNLLLSGAF